VICVIFVAFVPEREPSAVAAIAPYAKKAGLSCENPAPPPERAHS
jgi:hypothetical protein